MLNINVTENAVKLSTMVEENIEYNSTENAIKLSTMVGENIEYKFH